MWTPDDAVVSAVMYSLFRNKCSYPLAVHQYTRRTIEPTMRKHDVIHKTGCIIRIATAPEEDHSHSQHGEALTCGF